jgi:hypothetical protein
MQGADFEVLWAKLAGELEFDKPKIDLTGYETARRDAVSYAIIFRDVRTELFEKVEKSLSSTDAARVQTAIDGVFLELGRLAQAELELGILESSLKK